MNSETQSEGRVYAKLTWQDVTSGREFTFVLTPGSTATIGRHPSNDIVIPERHVSRFSAIIRYQQNQFLVSDLASAGGIFVNDQLVRIPQVLMEGDVIRLYVPKLTFSLLVSDEDIALARKGGNLITPATGTDEARLLIVSGVHQGTEIPLINGHISIGPGQTGIQWDESQILHPFLTINRQPDGWTLFNLGNANTVLLNDEPAPLNPCPLQDGDLIQVSQESVLFRLTRSELATSQP